MRYTPLCTKSCESFYGPCHVPQEGFDPRIRPQADSQHQIIRGAKLYFKFPSSIGAGISDRSLRIYENDGEVGMSNLSR